MGRPLCWKDHFFFRLHLRVIFEKRNKLNLGIAGLVVWYLASGAQGPRINTRLGHSRLG